MTRRETITKIMIGKGIHGICSFQLPLGCFLQCTEVTGIVRGYSVISKVIKVDLCQPQVAGTLTLQCEQVCLFVVLR